MSFSFIKTGMIAVAVIVLLNYFHCSNPFKDDKKKEEIIILWSGFLEPEGRFYFYWDGKDDNENYVEPGKYIAFAEIKNEQDDVFIQAMAGGEVGKNEDPRFYETYITLSNLIEDPFPNPFNIIAGINIPIIISEPAVVRLTIFKD